MQTIDLRGVSCPTNFVKAKLALEMIDTGEVVEFLLDDGEPVNVTRARELVDTAHRSAKEALTELRDLARGIHPPVLDGGLPDALATLTARSAVPAGLTADIPARPTAAIETIAYFCAAELLANAAKHSAASHVAVTAAARNGALRTVDGRLDISSPPGGPTVVTIELPLSA